MALQSNGYHFKPHELPKMAGSPATPEHTKKHRVLYFAIGLFLMLTAGLQNGLLTSSMEKIRGDLSLDIVESSWVQVAYFMSYTTISMLLFKIRQHFDLTIFIRYTLILTLLSNVLTLFFYTYEIALFARFILGVGTGGLFTLAMFYGMQAVSGMTRMSIFMLFSGLLPAITTLCQIFLPFLFRDGNTSNIFIFQFGMVLICISLTILLPLPPGITIKAIKPLDILNYLLYSLGVALLCAFFVLGRVVWWTTDWLGWLLSIGILLIGCVLFAESHRKYPLIDWKWLSARQFLMLLAISLVTRMYTAEESIGSNGLLIALGMDNEQLITYYVIIFISSVTGVILSILTLDLQDIRRNLVISLLGIAIGAYLDINVSIQTRAEQFYFSQAIVAFSSFYFAGAVMLEGFIRALSVSPNHIISFIAVLAVSQTLGGLMGAGAFSAYVTKQTKIHLLNLSQDFTLVNPTVESSLQLTKAIFKPDVSDASQSQALAVSHLITQMNIEATVLAYQDLFELIFLISSSTFLWAFCIWIYRRYKKINVLERELEALMKVNDNKKND